mgnify:CR=1 FL=1
MVYWLDLAELSSNIAGWRGGVASWLLKQCLNSGGTRGNAVPVRKLLPHLEGRIVPFKTHNLCHKEFQHQAFSAQFHVCSNFSSWLTDHRI